MKFSICTDMIFAGTDICEAIRTLHDMGVDTIEFWRWANKDLKRAKECLAHYNMHVSAFCVDCRDDAVSASLSRDVLNGGKKDILLAALKESVEQAKLLGTKNLIITLGLHIEGLSYETQMQNVRTCLEYVIPYLESEGMVLLLEPINRNERPTYIEPYAAPIIELIESLGSPSVKLLYDMFHQALTGDLSGAYIAKHIHAIGHFHVADVPGRNEPGTGTIDYPSLFETIRKTDYKGFMGLEFKPVGDLSEILISLNAM